MTDVEWEAQNRQYEADPSVNDKETT